MLNEIPKALTPILGLGGSALIGWLVMLVIDRYRARLSAIPVKIRLAAGYILYLALAIWIVVYYFTKEADLMMLLVPLAMLTSLLYLYVTKMKGQW